MKKEFSQTVSIQIHPRIIHRELRDISNQPTVIPEFSDRKTGFFSKNEKNPDFFENESKSPQEQVFFSPKDFDLIFRRRYNLSEVVTVSRIKLSA